MLKQESVQIEFTYENDVTEKDLKNIARKVQTFRKNCGYSTDVAFFATRHNIEVIVTFNETDRKIFDNVRYSLNRLIDSHKQPATYGWSLNVSDLLVEKVSA
jgi:hypothetical protein